MTKTQINIPVRLKNPWFWVGIGGTILTAMGADPAIFTSWAAVWEAVVGLFTNPYMLGCVFLAVMGVLIDPTTQGVNDSDQAMTYTSPKK